MSTRERPTRTDSAPEAAAATASGAALLGGAAWLGLVAAAELQRRGVVSYDAYNRLLAAPLVLFGLALSGSVRAARGHGRTARTGMLVAATGAAVLVVGNVIEFYGVLLQDGLNAQAAHEAGVDEHWIGSDVGWIVFGTGMLMLLGGGVVTAAALGPTTPLWLRTFFATLGLGVLAGNLFGLGPALVSVPALGAYGAAWMAYARYVRRNGLRPEPRDGSSA